MCNSASVKILEYSALTLNSGILYFVKFDPSNCLRPYITNTLTQIASIALIILAKLSQISNSEIIFATILKLKYNLFGCHFVNLKKNPKRHFSMSLGLVLSK